MLIRDRYFEDYEIGESRETVGRTITETDFVIHAGHTGDFFPHHMDVEFAKGQPFGKRIAHGTLVLSIGIGMTASEINSRAFSYGYDKVRFISPVFIGDTIKVRTIYTDKREYPKNSSYGMLVEGVEVVNQHDKVVLACQHIYLASRRP